MIIDHTYPAYRKKRNSLEYGNQHNGAYYYSKEIVKNIIPIVKTDRNWITVRATDLPKEIMDHSIIFIHNTRNPNYYEYLSQYDDLILVCPVPQIMDGVSFWGKTIYLPLSIDLESVLKYKKKEHKKDVCFAGRRSKITNRVPKNIDILTDMTQSQLLRAMADYKKVYAVGRCAVQARALGCEVLVYMDKYPDPKFWKVIDNKDAAKMLQEMLDEIDGVNNG